MINFSPAIEALAQRLAEAQSITVEDAVTQALEAHARQAGVVLPPARPYDPSPKAVAAQRARMTQIAQEIAAMPVLDRRTPREIMDDLNAQ